MPFIQALFAAAAGNSSAGGAPWDITTAVATGVVLNMSAQSSLMIDIALKRDGTALYAISAAMAGRLYTYTMSTPWDLSSATLTGSSNLPNTNAAYTSSGYAFTSYESAGVSRFAYSVLNYEGTTLRAGNRLQYYIGTTLYSTSSATSVLYTSMSGSENGTRTATIGAASTTVNFYSMSPSGDYSSLSSRGGKSVSTETSGVSATALFVRDDGLKFYVTAGQTIYEYDMATEWTGTTASYVASFDCSTEIGSETISGMALSADGTKLYVMTTADKVYEYTLG